MPVFPGPCRGHRGLGHHKALRCCGARVRPSSVKWQIAPESGGRSQDVVCPARCPGHEWQASWAAEWVGVLRGLDCCLSHGKVSKHLTVPAMWRGLQRPWKHPPHSVSTVLRAHQGTWAGSHQHAPGELSKGSAEGVCDPAVGCTRVNPCTWVQAPVALGNLVFSCLQKIQGSQATASLKNKGGGYNST